MLNFVEFFVILILSHFYRFYKRGVSEINSLVNKILHFFFPDTCIVCAKPTQKSRFACKKCENKIDYINPVFKCKTCLKQIPASNSRMCGFCMSQKPQYSRLISCLSYKGWIKNTLRLYKFHNRPDLHIGYSKLACEILERDGVFFDAIVCVPLHKNKLLERGYNQSALIAKNIAKYFEVPFYEDLLVKIKDTKTQSDLTYKERIKNVKGAFSVKCPDRICGRTVLLVDDIYTTGSTMREVSKVCAPFADEIIAFTIARGILE